MMFPVIKFVGQLHLFTTEDFKQSAQLSAGENKLG